MKKYYPYLTAAGLAVVYFFGVAWLRPPLHPVLLVSDSEERVWRMPAVSEKSYRRRGGLFIVRCRKLGEVTL